MDYQIRCWRVVVIIMVGLALPPSTATGQAPWVRPDSKTQPLWIRYLNAGKDAQKKKKTDIAKRYLLGSLSELEKTYSRPGKPVKSQAGELEQELVKLYDVDWSKVQGGQEAKLRLREEQVQVLARINRFNQAHHMNHTVREQFQREYDRVAGDLEKEKAGAPVGENEAPSDMPRLK